MKNKSLLFSALLKLIFGFVAVFILVFLPRGTLRYINGWIFLSVLFAPMLVFGGILFFKNPALLRLRLRHKENQNQQKAVVFLSVLMFVFGFVLSGICVKYGILIVPLWVSIVFSVFFLFGYTLYATVLFENKYLSRNVEVFENQTVIATGIYSIVRHPMYLSTIIMFLSIPFILGAFPAFFVFLSYPFIIAYRIKYEEELLLKELCDYAEYKKKVKFKVIPFIW